MAYLLWYSLLARMPADTSALVLLLIPTIVVISSILLLFERPTTAGVSGLLLMTIAAAAVMVPAAQVALRETVLVSVHRDLRPLAAQELQVVVSTVLRASDARVAEMTCSYTA